MRKLSAEHVTGLIIVGTTSGMAIPLILWFVRDPAWFAGDLLDINAEAGQVPWAWTLAVAVGYVAYTLWTVPFTRVNATTFSRLKALAIPLALVTGTLEELIFRKWLMDALDSGGVSILVQVAAAGLAFGLVHSVWAFFSREARIIAPVVIATTILGTLLAITYLVGDRNVLPVIVAHIVINLVIEPWLLLSSVNGRWNSPKREVRPPSNSRRRQAASRR